MTIEIPLTKGYVAIVDDEDADLAAFKWTAYRRRTGTEKYTAQRSLPRINGKRSVEQMHRTIMSRKLGRPLLPHEEVDHIHGNTLDNRRSKLRLATRVQNMRNTGKYSNNSSGYKGVDWCEAARQWRARTRVNGKSVYLGLFSTPEDAYKAYCAAIFELHGEFANPG